MQTGLGIEAFQELRSMGVGDPRSLTAGGETELIKLGVSTIFLGAGSETSKSQTSSYIVTRFNIVSQRSFRHSCLETL